MPRIGHLERKQMQVTQQQRLPMLRIGRSDHGKKIGGPITYLEGALISSKNLNSSPNSTPQNRL